MEYNTDYKGNSDIYLIKVDCWLLCLALDVKIECTISKVSTSKHARSHLVALNFIPADGAPVQQLMGHLLPTRYNKLLPFDQK